MAPPRSPSLGNQLDPIGQTRITLPGINMEVENHLFVVDFVVLQGAILHFHVSSRECELNSAS